MILGPKKEIHLRAFEQEDAPGLVKLANNRNVSINLRDGFPFPYTLADAQKFIQLASEKQPPTIFAIIYKEMHAGNIGLHPASDVYRKSAEIGYFLGEDFWGKGIATAAVQLITQYGFDQLGLNRIYAGVFEFNPSSMRVLEKCGYEREGIHRKAVYKNGEFWDEVRFAKLNNTVHSSNINPAQK